MINVFNYRHKATAEVRASLFYKQSWKALSCVVYDGIDMIAYFSMNRKDEIAEYPKAGCEIMDIWYKPGMTTEKIRKILTYIIQIIRLWSPRHPKLFNYVWLKKSISNSQYVIDFMKGYDLAEVKDYEDKVVSRCSD